MEHSEGLIAIKALSTPPAPELDVRQTYEATAPFYDRLTAHHDYELWLGNLLPALEAHGLAGKRLLDVACGTGKSFLPMLERGWQVTAVDISPAMLAQARAKAGGRARLLAADMRRLPRLGEFDLVWCLDDALNYVLSEAELERALAGLRRNLRPGGLCLFDLSTLAMYRDFFAARSLIEDDEGTLIVAGQAGADFAPGGIAEAIVEIPGPQGQSARRITHRQRHFRPREVEAAIARAGLEELACFGHGYDAVLQQPLDEAIHTKAIFITTSKERG